MTAYACADYFTARVPDFTTILPGYPIPIAIQAAISLYWDRFVPQESGLWVLNPIKPNCYMAPPIDETLLSERQKAIVGLRCCLGLVAVFTQALTQPQLIDGQGGPAIAKFEERNKLIRVLMPMWQTELKNLEAFENIFFDLLPSVPAYLQKLTEFSVFDSSVGYVVSSGTWFVDAHLGDGQQLNSNNALANDGEGVLGI